MAHTKALGSTKNGRDSNSKRLGIKKNNGESVTAGEIILRQRGTKILAGANIGMGKDDTLFAMKSGIVSFRAVRKINYNSKIRQAKEVSVIPTL